MQYVKLSQFQWYIEMLHVTIMISHLLCLEVAGGNKSRSLVECDKHHVGSI